MTRLAVLSDIHGNLAGARGRPQGRPCRASRTSSLVAGDLVFNGPDPAGVVDLLRTMESDGAIVVAGQHRRGGRRLRLRGRVPVDDRRVPETYLAAAEWAHDAARRRAPRVAPPAAGRAPRAGRGRHHGPGLPCLARLADRRLRPGARSQRHPRAGHADRRPGHLPAATRTCQRSATLAGRSSSTPAPRATSSTATRRPRGPWSTCRRRRGSAEIHRTDFDALAVVNAISARGLPGDVYRAATVRTGKLVR